ncbi:hypothetical protein B0H34DRAFT_801552 [Crassisporium funariophilum]|nr:hypothetical protein B0H34DRAFT_801552 [Crassisporium funariophilum]
MHQKSTTLSSEIRDAETCSSKATKAEFAKDYDQAFRLYIKTAESFLHLSRSATQPEKVKQQWKNNASKALERAERIKRFVEKPGGSTNTSNVASNSGQPPANELRLTPVGINHFSPQEQLYVLKKGGNINGLVFPVWEERVSQGYLTSPYNDPDGQPKLSPEQQKVSSVWRRPNPITKVCRRILPQDVLQHIVTDCSVCASISVCLEHARRFNSTLAEFSIDNYSSGPKGDGESGRYDIRVLINGVWRRTLEPPGYSQIVIDDKLPFNPSDGSLMCMSILPSSTAVESTSTEEISWPSLLEKGYMKLMGGYDFPGSSNFEREKSWERIKNGFSTGQCVVTLGTGPSAHVHWRDVRLLPSHSYAVIDVLETEEGRMMTVLDSWVRSNGEGSEPSRILQIPWSEVLNTFDGVYLSWDPAMWETCLTFHGMWKRSGQTDTGSRQLQMNFNTSGAVDGEIWVLLTRHVVDTRRDSDFIALRVEIEDDLMHGRRVGKHDILSSNGTYTNSTHILARTRIPASQRSGTLTILASYDGDHSEVGFTLSAYAKKDMNAAWIENTPAPPYTAKVEGTLTSKNAGGNYTYPTFMVNPQYHLVIHPPNARLQNTVNGRTEKAKATLTLQTSKDMPVNVAVVWSQGQRVAELAEKELAATSGAYSYGLARVTEELSVGEYTVVASAFEPHHMGPFSLNIDSSYPFDIKPIPQEGAGMYSKIVRGAWEGDTAAGGPSFDRYSKNPVFELDVPSLAHLKIRLQLVHPSTAIALNVTVYPSIYKGSPISLTQQRHVTTSGSYDDTIAGVSTPQIAIGAGKYHVVPSTYNPGIEVGFKIIVYSSVAGVKLTPLQRS